MRRIEKLLVLVALGGAGLAVMGQAASRPATAGVARKVPFTVSKETTAITEPLQEDGTVDYILAINNKYGMGVTADNNGFATWLKVVGTGDYVLAPKTKEVVLLMLGVKETPPGVEVWEGYEATMKRRKGLSDDKRDPHDPAAVAAYDTKVAAFDDELRIAARGLWRAEEHPDLAAFIQGREKLLALAAQAADKPRWWVPALPINEWSLLSALRPPLNVRDVTQTLCARAMGRATTGDMAGFLKDIRTVRQLARQVGGGPSEMDRMTGGPIEMEATGAMAGWAASGTLTEGQCKTLEAALDGFGPMPSMVESVDCAERWASLDMVQGAAVVGLGSGPLEWLGADGGIEQIPSGYAGKIDREEVDWDAVLKRVNAVFDENRKLMGLGSMKELRAAGNAMDRQWDELMNEGYGGRLARNLAGQGVGRPADSDEPVDLSKGAAETRAAYTDRVTKIFLALMRPSYGITEELYRRCDQQREMVRVVLAAAEVKARTGKWPTKLEELVPGVLKELPKDMYSAGGAMPFRYLVKENGVRVYSVGVNGRDDGGVREGPEKDDLGVGVN